MSANIDALAELSKPEQLRPRILEHLGNIFDDLGPRLAAGKTVDLHADVSMPLTHLVLAERVGVPEDDREWLADTLTTRDEVTALIFEDYFLGLVADRRTAPRDDLISRLVQAHDEPALLIAILWTMWTAGYESTETGEVIDALTREVADHPVRERLVQLLMLALCRSGRQAEALAAFRAVRASLVEQLGVEPGLELRQLHAGRALPRRPALRRPPGLRAELLPRATGGSTPPAARESRRRSGGHPGRPCLPGGHVPQPARRTPGPRPARQRRRRRTGPPAAARCLRQLRARDQPQGRLERPGRLRWRASAHPRRAARTPGAGTPAFGHRPRTGRRRTRRRTRTVRLCGTLPLALRVAADGSIQSDTGSLARSSTTTRRRQPGKPRSNGPRSAYEVSVQVAVSV